MNGSCVIGRHEAFIEPLQGSEFACRSTQGGALPRAALRLPWALRSNPFGVKASEPCRTGPRLASLGMAKAELVCMAPITQKECGLPTVMK